MEVPKTPGYGLPKREINLRYPGDEEEWELEKILDKRKRRKDTEYLVQYKGFPLYRDMQWRPEAELTELAPGLLKDFQTELKKSEDMS